MSKRIALLSAAAFGVLALTATIAAPVSAQEKTVDGRRCCDVPLQEHHPERRQLQGPHHAGGRGEGRGPSHTLEGKGPFTVFAPTNTAFGKLPAGTVDTLVKPENRRP